MKTADFIRRSVFCLLVTPVIISHAQQQVASIVTNNTSSASTGYSNVKGAGLRNAANALSSNWDSAGTAFTVNFSATANNITSITQFNVTGHPRPFITWPLNALVKVRRLANAYVPDTRNYDNYWSVTSSIPVNGAVSGTFNLLAPEISSQEAAFLTNNINSGYDNIFQNSINSLHANNIERVDYIMPAGLKPAVQLDLDGAGAVVFDRGTGDPFKIAVILSVDANNDPLTYGPLLSVVAAQFGPDLKASASNYCILTHDPNYGTVSRPSTQQTQNMRGVFISLTDMGVGLNQRFYGYSLFGQDVATANPDWTTYPNNSNAASQIDPVNVMAVFKDVNSILPVPIDLYLKKQNSKPQLQFMIYNMVANDGVAVERSLNGYDFKQINLIPVTHEGQYFYTDADPATGTIYYRLKFVQKDGTEGYSPIRAINMEHAEDVQLFPNPAKEAITLSFPASWNQGKINAVLIDASGSKRKEENFTATGSIKIHVGNLESGVYFIQIKNQETEETLVKQFMIARQ